MFRRLGQFGFRRRKAILILTGLFVVLAGVVGGGGVFSKLKGGGFEDPTAESTRAREYLDEQLGVGDPNLVLVVSTPAGRVDDAAVTAAGQALTARVAGLADVANVVS